MSALTGEGTDALVSRLEKAVLDGRRPVRYFIPNSKAGALSRVYELANVTDVRYGEDGIAVTAVSDPKARGMLAEFICDGEG